MKIEVVNIHNKGKKLAEVYSYLDYDFSISNKKEFISKLITNTKPITGYGYGGYSTKKFLASQLDRNIFGAEYNTISELKISKEKIYKLIKNALIKCNRILPVNNLVRIFLYPTFNDFVINRMGGTTGTAPWKEIIHIFVNPVKGWGKHLTETLVHEYNHTVAYEYLNWDALINKIILEGFAEVFSEELLNKKPFVSSAVSLSKSQSIFKQLKKYLNSRSYVLYRKVFYDDKEYPLWSGYSIGYWIVKTYKAKHRNISWVDLLSTPIKVILSKSRFM